MKRSVTVLVLGSLLLVAGTAAAAPTGKPTGKGPCRAPVDCQGGICIDLNNAPFCSQACGECPAGMYCDEQLFTLFNLKVCAKGSLDRPLLPDKSLPKLPCTKDDECQGSMVCATIQTTRTCTVECTSPDQCKVPDLPGQRTDFMTCTVDESKRTRNVCLPKKECLKNPASCVGAPPKGYAQPGYPAGTANPAWGAGGQPTGVDGQPPPMAEGQFQGLLAEIKKQHFAADRTRVIDLAAKANYFTCDQAGRILDLLTMSDEKLSSLKLLAPRLVDRATAYTLLSRFTFDEDKKKASELLNP